MKSLLRIAFLASSMFAAGCATDPTSTSSARRAIIDQSCAADTDCPTGFECEIEVEHGVTTSFCQADDESGTCPAGYELEVEHGQSYCKPHGGSGGGSDDGSGSGSDDGSGSGGGSDDGAGHT